MNNDYQKKVLGDEYIAGADGDRCELERKLKKEKKKCKKLSKELQHTKGGKKLKKKLKRKIKKKNERIKQLERKLEAQEIAISCCKSNVWKETIAKCLPDALKAAESLLLIRAAKKYDGSFVPSSRFEYNTASKMINPYTALIETNERTNND